ncbi:MAG: hypothetical protein VKO21_03615 [Candidatus Sericytochromatia bacterium]|nr:hypothetical protein [Candidatus Sericytochromatia bacterium]
MAWLLLDALPRTVSWPPGQFEALRHEPGNLQAFLDACGSGRTWDGVIVAGTEDVLNETVRGIRVAFGPEAPRLLASTHLCLLSGTPATAPLNDSRGFIERMATEGVRVVSLPSRDPAVIKEAIVGLTAGTAPLGSNAEVPDYYTLLGLPEKGSIADLSAAIANYRSFWQSRLDHPSLQHDARSAMELLDEAGVLLLDEQLRRTYDAQLAEARQQAGNRLVVPKVQPVALQRPPESFTGHGWSKSGGVGSRTDRLDKMAARYNIGKRTEERPEKSQTGDLLAEGSLPPTFHLPGLGFRWRSKDSDDAWPPVDTPEGWLPLDDPEKIEEAVRLGGLTPRIQPQSEAPSPEPPSVTLEEIVGNLADPVSPVATPTQAQNLADPIPPVPQRPEAFARETRVPERPEEEDPALAGPLEQPSGLEPDTFVILPLPDAPVFVLEAAQLDLLERLEDPEDLLVRYLAGEMDFPSLEELEPSLLRGEDESGLESEESPEDAEDLEQESKDRLEPFDQDLISEAAPDEPHEIERSLEEDWPPRADVAPDPQPAVEEPSGPDPDPDRETDAWQEAEIDEALLESVAHLDQDPELESLFRRYGTGPLEPLQVQPSDGQSQPPASPAAAAALTQEIPEEPWSDLEDLDALRAVLGSAPDEVFEPVRAPTPAPPPLPESEQDAELLTGPQEAVQVRETTDAPPETTMETLVNLPEAAFSRFRSLDTLGEAHRISLPVDLEWPLQGEAALLGDTAWGPEGITVHRIMAVVPIQRLGPGDLERLVELGLIGWMLPGPSRQAARRLDDLDPLPHEVPAADTPAFTFPGMDDDQDELLLKLLAEEGYEGPIEAAVRTEPPSEAPVLDSEEGLALLEEADEDEAAYAHLAVRRDAPPGMAGMPPAPSRPASSAWRHPVRWWQDRGLRRQRDRALLVQPVLVPQGHRPLTLVHAPERGECRFMLRTPQGLAPLTPLLDLPSLNPSLNHLPVLRQQLHRVRGTLTGLAVAAALVTAPTLLRAARDVLPPWPQPRAAKLEVKLAEAPAGTLLSWQEPLDQVIVLRASISDQDAHWSVVGHLDQPKVRYLVDPWPLEHPGRYRYLVGGVRWQRPWAPWRKDQAPDRERPYRTWLSGVLKPRER